MVGVSLDAGAWAAMTGLILVGLVPFVVLGDPPRSRCSHQTPSGRPSAGSRPCSPFSVVPGGRWPPPGVLLSLVKVLPSYWLVQAGKTAIGGHGWPVEAWIVLGVWVLGLGWLAGRVYLRDTARV